VPTLIYTEDAPPARFVLEDEATVNSAFDRAREAGAEFVTFTGEGGKYLRIEVSSVRRVSAQ
jgi:hypothetical protein